VVRQQVWNLRKGHPKPLNGVRVDRTTNFGNPFIVGVHGIQGECCDKHEQWLDTGENFGNLDASQILRQWVLEHIYTLKDRDLLCWCFPARCHADKLVKMANNL
jgi:hypothetical protein